MRRLIGIGLLLVGATAAQAQAPTVNTLAEMRALTARLELRMVNTPEGRDWVSAKKVLNALEAAEKAEK